ncbi:toast rack family protein [Candidatus Leptofilum sp.]|uniref:toast rack family protein n=1 Tax=Candidatus Leptofilum sp. TaxID=3241576 RepID=UPI003B5B60EE
MKKLTIFMLLGGMFLLVGCINTVAVGPVQTDSQSVELGDVDSVRVEINMGIGELNVEGGAANLLDAEFTYNIEDWRPEVSYEQRGNIGELQISQPDGEINGIPDDDIKYNWDIALQNDVPMDLNVDLGVGESDLTLGGLQLRNLTVDTGVGDVTIDLTGSWQEDLDVNIDGGVGEATIYLPENVGLRVEADTGIGSLVVNGLQREGDSDVYTNESYGDADVNMTLDISGGIGEITVRVGR